MKLEANEADGQYMHDYVKEAGGFTRSPGSAGERRGAELTAEKMQEFADEVNIEEFEFAPKAALGWIKFIVPLFFVALFVFYIAPVLSALIMLFSLLVIVGQFVFYRKIVDPFFPKAKSQNVYSKNNPSEDTRQTIIFAGHIDSPYQFNFIKWWGGRVYTILMVLVIVTFIFFSITSISNGIAHVAEFFNYDWGGIVGGDNWLHTRWIISICLSPVTALFFFFTTWKDTPGCGDNLSGVAVALGVGNALNRAKQNGGFYPRHTRVITMGFGAEESFLRGAMAYVDAHKEELKEQKVTLINMETLVEPGDFFVLKKDLNGTVKMTSHVVDDVIRAAKEKGLNMKKISMPFGGGSTDSAAFARAGIDTTCIFGVDLGKIIKGTGYFNHYHTDRDTPDKVKPKALQQVLDVCLQYLQDKDEEVSKLN